MWFCSFFKVIGLAVITANIQDRSSTPALTPVGESRACSRQQPNLTEASSLHNHHEQICSCRVMPNALKFSILGERKGDSDQLCLSPICIHRTDHSLDHVPNKCFLYVECGSTLCRASRHLSSAPCHY